jgi:hypothetical protein
MKKYLLIFCIISVSTLFAANYEKKNDSVIIDKSHKLYWQDDFSSEKSSEDFDDAIEFCDELDLGGLTHWRLPTFGELFSTTDYARVPPVEEHFVFLNDGTYWTSTPFAANKSRAWTINFHTGETYYSYKTTNHAVRCVKDMPKAKKESK